MICCVVTEPSRSWIFRTNHRCGYRPGSVAPAVFPFVFLFVLHGVPPFAVVLGYPPRSLSFVLCVHSLPLTPAATLRMIRARSAGPDPAAIPDRLTPATDGRSSSSSAIRIARSTPAPSESVARSMASTIPGGRWRPGNWASASTDRRSVITGTAAISRQPTPGAIGSIGELAHVGHRAGVVQDGEVGAGPLLGDEAVCSAPQRRRGGALGDSDDGPESSGLVSDHRSFGSEDDRIGVPESRRRMVSGGAQHGGNSCRDETVDDLRSSGLARCSTRDRRDRHHPGRHDAMRRLDSVEVHRIVEVFAEEHGDTRFSVPGEDVVVERRVEGRPVVHHHSRHLDRPWPIRRVAPRDGGLPDERARALIRFAPSV